MKYFFASILVSLGRGHFGSLFASEKQKRLVSDVFHTFATRVSLIYDVTDTDCWAQNGSTHGRVFAIFKQKTRNPVKNYCL